MIFNMLKKSLNSLKKMLPIIKIPTMLTLMTTFSLKIGHVINSTNLLLSSSGIADRITYFLTNPRTWLNNSSISERFINAAKIFASWLPENLVDKMAILWLNTKDYLKTNISNQTTGLFAALVFGTATLVSVMREMFKAKALHDFLDRLKQEQKQTDAQYLTPEQMNIFNVGRNAHNSTLSKLKSCFSIEAILNPTAYYAGLEFASLPKNDEIRKTFTNQMKRHADFLNLVNEYKLLSQVELNQALYSLENRNSLVSTKLTAEELQKAKALLFAGADANYLPSQAEYRNKIFEPCTLIASSINAMDLDFFNLLLEHKADIFKESKSSNKIIWEAFLRSWQTQSSMLLPEVTYIVNTMLKELETTTEEIRTFVSLNKDIAISVTGEQSFRTFVQEMKTKLSTNESSLKDDPATKIAEPSPVVFTFDYTNPPPPGGFTFDFTKPPPPGGFTFNPTKP